jgi:TIGR03009 family protein
MLIRHFSVLALLILGSIAWSQGVSTPATVDSDQVLRGWQKAMNGVQNFHCIAKRETFDAQLKTSDQYQGFAILSNASHKGGPMRAHLQLVKKSKQTNPSFAEKFICTGPELYEYAPASQKVRIHQLPQGGLRQVRFLTFLFGMSIDQTKDRYRITPDKGKPQTHYHLIWFEPKAGQDDSDFVKARVALYKSNNMVAQLTYQQANGNTTTWSFTDLQLNRKLPANAFDPVLPKGWQFERVESKLPPLPPRLR